MISTAAQILLPNSAEAVEIVTWHGSKGREWPITVVAEFDYAIVERPGTTSTKFEALDRIDDRTAVLASARLIHTHAFAAPGAQVRFIEDRRVDFEANTRNLLNVALTRAHDRLVLEWPGFLKERDEETPVARCLFHVFEDGCKPQLSGDKLRVGVANCSAVIKELPDQTGFDEIGDGVLLQAPRLGKPEALPTIPLPPWRL